MSANEEEILFALNKIRSATVGTIHYPPGANFGPRMQKDVQLVLLHTGSIKVNVDGEEFVMKPGHVMILNPGHYEYFDFDCHQVTWHRWISLHFEPMSMQEEIALSELPRILPIPEAMNRLIDSMLSLRMDYSEEDEVMCSLGYALFKIYTSEHTRTKKIKHVHPSVLLAKSMVNNHFSEEMTLGDLAYNSGVSPEHLVRLFRTFEETTPIKYLWHYRVMRAVELLIHTGLTIKEIAPQCGFKTTYHFARSIKRHTGSTPTEIRESSWRGAD